AKPSAGSWLQAFPFTVPSLAVFWFGLAVGRARDKSQRRRARPGGEGGSDDASAVAAVLGAVRRVERIVEVVIALLKRDVLLETAGRDAAFVANLRPPEPSRAGPVDGADVEVVTVADDPDRDRPSQRAVPSV